MKFNNLGESFNPLNQVYRLNYEIYWKCILNSSFNPLNQVYRLNKMD